MNTRIAGFGNCVMILLLGFSVAAQSGTGSKELFREVEGIVKGGMSEEAYLEAKTSAAKAALEKLGEVSGPDLYYRGMLESVAGQWERAARHFQQYLALPLKEEYESRMNRLTAQGQLRESFVKGGLVADAEKYYANDPIALGLFYSSNGQPERAIDVYETFLAANPPLERRRVVKSIILSTLTSMKKPDEAAVRFERYKDDLTPNSVINNYSSLARLYHERGDRSKSEKYTELVLDYGKKSRDGKAVDGPLVAHIGWIIGLYEAVGEQAKLAAFIVRLRSELAGKKAVTDYLGRREVFGAVLNKPARELEADYFLNGERTTLKDLRKRVVVLDFFAHWCGPCIKGFPFKRSLLRKYGTKGLTILGVSGIYGYYKGVQSLDPDQEVGRMHDEFAREHEITWPMIFGRTKANNENYGVGYIPHLVVIDRKGVVRYAKIGKPDEAELEKEVIKLLSETAADAPVER